MHTLLSQFVSALNLAVVGGLGPGNEGLCALLHIITPPALHQYKVELLHASVARRGVKCRMREKREGGSLIGMLPQLMQDCAN